MWASSLAPDLGLIGITGTPATSAPMTATAVSIRGSASTATRARPVKLGGDGARRRGELRVGQRPVREAQRGAVGGGVGEGREEHGVTVCPTGRG